MRKSLIIATILALTLGCATLGNIGQDIDQFACKPTATQQTAAETLLALAQSALTSWASEAPNSLVVQALANPTTGAIAIAQMVIKGICATQAQWSSAVNAVDQASSSSTANAAMEAKLGASVKPVISYLNNITPTWPKKN